MLKIPTEFGKSQTKMYNKKKQQTASQKLKVTKDLVKQTLAWS